MSIGRLNWRVVKIAGFSVALICAAAIESQAASIPMQQAGRQIAMAAFSADQATPRLASFADRFGHLEASAIESLLTSPTYQAPVFRRSIQYVPAGETLDGAASMYDPTDKTDRDSGDLNTSSGEAYDPEAWTAAIRTDLRDQFGGVRYGRNYVRCFALLEANGLRLIVRINDVGPLRSGRVIDLNKRAMRYFDPTLKQGVLEHIKVTPLAGSEIAAGPVEDAPAFASRFAAVWK